MNISKIAINKMLKTIKRLYTIYSSFFKACEKQLRYSIFVFLGLYLYDLLSSYIRIRQTTITPLTFIKPHALSSSYWVIVIIKSIPKNYQNQ
jgi:hypothetical protein